MNLDSPAHVVAPQQQGLSLEATPLGGRIRIKGADGAVVAELQTGLDVTVLALGGHETFGALSIKDGAGTRVMFLNGRDQNILLYNHEGRQTVEIDGATGDVKLSGADAAEEFEIAAGSHAQPGSVMVVGEDNHLTESAQAYDGRVVGVVSGANDLRPGIVLGRAPGGHRVPIALAGRVYCRAMAGAHDIQRGDLLTPSDMPGHAMRAADRERAFGAVLGKALAPLAKGTGLIPILVSLQ
jgi:hypothetical protein